MLNKNRAKLWRDLVYYILYSHTQAHNLGFLTLFKLDLSFEYIAH